jgi:hypothetical protein
MTSSGVKGERLAVRRSDGGSDRYIEPLAIGIEAIDDLIISTRSMAQ